jgi:hypothetical protein
MPHAYIVRRSTPDPRLFTAAVECLRENGKPEKFGKATYRYFYRGRWKYWNG